MLVEDEIVYVTMPKNEVPEVDPSREFLEYLVSALEKHPDLAARTKIALTEKR